MCGHTSTVPSIKPNNNLIYFYFQENTDKEITLHNVKYSASFSAVLKYIYGFDLNLWDHLIETLCEICHLARDYSLPMLHERLTCYLSKYRAITLENAATLITTADTHNIHTLIERVTNFLHQNAGELIQHESFLRIEHGVLMDLLESDLFYAREIDILSAVLRWIDFNVKTGNVLKRFENITVFRNCFSASKVLQY
jgi:BTB And C-terminal Kelch.